MTYRKAAGCSLFVRLRVPEGHFVSSGPGSLTASVPTTPIVHCGGIGQQYIAVGTPITNSRYGDTSLAFPRRKTLIAS